MICFSPAGPGWASLVPGATEGNSKGDVLSPEGFRLHLWGRLEEAGTRGAGVCFLCHSRAVSCKGLCVVTSLPLVEFKRFLANCSLVTVLDP